MSFVASVFGAARVSAALRVLPDPVLRQVAAPFESRAAIVAAAPLVETMRRALRDTADSVGIAAPQVGASQRLFCIDDPISAFPFQAFFNPRLTAVHGRRRQQLIPECCLSVPDVVGVVRRPMHVTVAFDDERGDPHTLELHGFWAQMVQHELDHLDGVLFIDKLAVAKTWSLSDFMQLTEPDVRDEPGLELTTFSFHSWMRLDGGARVFSKRNDLVRFQ